MYILFKTLSYNIGNGDVGSDTCNIAHFTERGCFPSNTKIKLGNGQIVMMSDLQKGDKVQTGNRK